MYPKVQNNSHGEHDNKGMALKKHLKLREPPTKKSPRPIIDHSRKHVEKEITEN